MDALFDPDDVLPGRVDALFDRAAEPFDRVDDRFDGTLPPSLRASERPMAIACLRLVTFLPERPLRSLPRFISCIDFSTLVCAFFPYLAMTFSVRSSFIGQNRRKQDMGREKSPYLRGEVGHAACTQDLQPIASSCSATQYFPDDEKEHSNDNDDGKQRNHHQPRSYRTDTSALCACRMQLHRAVRRTILQRSLSRGARRRLVRLQSSGMRNSGQMSSTSSGSM